MTPAQRATLEKLAGDAEHLARMSEGLPLAEQGYRNEADALRAALGTCANCRHYQPLEPYGVCHSERYMMVAMDHFVGAAKPSVAPDHGCHGWTAEQGA